MFVERAMPPRTQSRRDGMFAEPPRPKHPSPVRGDMFIERAADSDPETACYKHVVPPGLHAGTSRPSITMSPLTGLLQPTSSRCYKHVIPTGLNN